MFVPIDILKDLFPVNRFDVNEDHDYFQNLFTDPNLIDEREAFLEAVDTIWLGLMKNKQLPKG